MRSPATLAAALALTSLAACACESEDVVVVDGVELLRIGSVNVALIDWPGGRFLVDSGVRGSEERIVAELKGRDLDPEDFAGLLLTHAHSDHAGAAAALQERGMPVWVHEADAETLTEGTDPPAEVIGAEATVVFAAVDHTFDPVDADVAFADLLELPEIGAVVEVAGGHTPGSITIVIDEKVALVGDLLRGGLLGGALFADDPEVHYFHEDKDAAHQALRDLLERHPDVETIWAAHGGPFPREIVEEFLDALPE